MKYDYYYRIIALFFVASVANLNLGITVLAASINEPPYSSASPGYYWASGSYPGKFMSAAEAARNYSYWRKLEFGKDMVFDSYQCGADWCVFDGVEYWHDGYTPRQSNFHIGAGLQQGAVSFVSPSPLCDVEPSLPRPIFISNGNKVIYDRDLNFEASSSSFRLSRNYSSTAYDRPDSYFPFGSRWNTSFSGYISYATFMGEEFVGMYKPNGSVQRYLKNSSGWYSTPEIIDVLADLNNPDGQRHSWIVFNGRTQAIEIYNLSGRLILMMDASGGEQTLTYDTLNRLSTVKDSFGRLLSFAYDANSRVQSITTPSGVLQYDYDTDNNLTSVTYPDGKVKQYHYEDSRFPHALTGITDENGVRYITYNYDEQGRAMGEVLTGGVEFYQLAFGTNQTTVTDPLGTQRVYNFTNILGALKSTGSSQPGGSGCAPSASSLAYDGNGNVTTRTDFNGVTTKYSYDFSRNLETQRIEAFGKAEQKTISTQWHSYWRLPTAVAEPLKKTTYLYNGDDGRYCAPPTATVPRIQGGTQPISVLCSKTGVATTDSNGSADFDASVVGTPRTWTWTYNQYGQVLTADGPRGDVNDTMVYTYYDAADSDLGKRGNIATITNAMGHVTQFTRYNAHGQVEEIVDPNGVLTTLTYDLRQRLTSRATAGETTGYQYDGVGQLTRLTLPDGSFISYTYDGARRLTAVADSLGNSIAYTLDLAGNRTKEDVLDPQGALVKTLGRAYDALGRLQTLTGVGNE